MTLTDDRLSIADAAAATGLSTHTLRYYERAGLMLTPVDRASSTHRRYGETDLGWVRFLTKLRLTGMPIAVMREYTDLVRQGDVSVPERLALLRRHREAVRAQLDDIVTSLDAVEIKISIYEEKAATS